MITDTQGRECSQEDWDALWRAFEDDTKGEELLSSMMGVLTHPEMVYLWKMTAAMGHQWGVAEAVRVFPDLQYRSEDRVRQALAAMWSHPPAVA